jgi:coenzyme F420-reducing hydrogenase alpha subunit
MSKAIKIDYLTRVEGEGALSVNIRDGRVADVKLKIFEPPRFFEALLRGRHFREGPDITARVCGICPVAYQMSSCATIEDALGVKVPQPIRQVRRLLYCGVWIASHALHIYLLHAPDFLGYEDAIGMAKDQPETAQAGLRLKMADNDIIRVLGGREIQCRRNKRVQCESVNRVLECFRILASFCGGEYPHAKIGFVESDAGRSYSR